MLKISVDSLNYKNKKRQISEPLNLISDMSYEDSMVSLLKQNKSKNKKKRDLCLSPDCISSRLTQDRDKYGKRSKSNANPFNKSLDKIELKKSDKGDKAMPLSIFTFQPTKPKPKLSTSSRLLKLICGCLIKRL